MTDKPTVSPKVKAFMKVFEKMGVTFVDKDGKKINTDDDLIVKDK